MIEHIILARSDECPVKHKAFENSLKLMRLHESVKKAPKRLSDSFASTDDQVNGLKQPFTTASPYMNGS